MESSSSEILGTLYQARVELTQTENELWFSSLFCLENYIAKNSNIDLVINDEIRPTFVYFYGEVEIYKWYYVFTHLSSNEYIRNTILRIKNVNGLEVGSWKLFNNIINTINYYDEIDESTLPTSSSTTSLPITFPSPLSDTSDEPLIPSTPPSLQNNIFSCINCGVKKTPLWRIERMERYCNACWLYLKRNGTPRKFDVNSSKVLRKKRVRKYRVCAECNTTTSPIWRNCDDKTYCNKHGLAKKKEQRFSHN
ncbi:hypothetical protein C1645_822121 [Glomus cerebriforme]|uniref:GATA-type domain-containing protein n=1 Tax=Glomus cerebriforme TaxID=658196 RepID=A0A397SYY5_9GLOM|nr:hypothetical protein C1645_822121 [Glomus cerebriforme]